MGKNLPGLKGGFHKDHVAKALGVYNEGYQCINWPGSKGKMVKLPAYVDGTTAALWAVQTDPNPYRGDVTQAFPIGSRLYWGDRAWAYVLLGDGEGQPADTTYNTYGALKVLIADDLIPQALTNIAGAAGATTVTCTNAGTPGADGYAGGYIHIQPRGTTDGTDWWAQSFGVEGNNVAGTSIIIDEPLPSTITGIAGSVIKSPFHQVVISSVSAEDCNRMIVGCYNSHCSDTDGSATHTVSGNWCWAQTWGAYTPSVVSAYGTQNDSARMVVGGDGASTQPITGTYTYATEKGKQIVGYNMYDQTGGLTVTAYNNWVYLTISR